MTSVVDKNKVAEWREWIGQNGPDMTALMLATMEHQSGVAKPPEAKAESVSETDHENHDGCGCDIELAELDATPDHDLPETVGGIIPA